MKTRRIASRALSFGPTAHSRRPALQLQCHRNLHIPVRPICIPTSILLHDAGRSRTNRPNTVASSSTPTIRSASTATASKPIRRPSHLPKHAISSLLNPPPETYAPPLDLPPKRPDTNPFAHLYRIGKAYIAFYKSGVLRVWANYKLSRTLRARLTATARKSSAVSTLTEIRTVNGEKILLPNLSRAEWQIIRRSARDISRLPAFAPLVLIFGEWLPLLVMYLTPFVPDPCRIPRQVHRVDTKREKRRRQRLTRLAMAARSHSVGKILEAQPGNKGEGLDLKTLDHRTLMRYSSRLDTHSPVWDWVFFGPPDGLLRWGLGKRIRYLDTDDALIKRDGGVGGLNGVEVRLACVERGFDTVGRGEEELRRELRGWFKG